MDDTDRLIMEIHGKVGKIEATMATKDDVTSAIDKHFRDCKNAETQVSPSMIRWAKKIGWYVAAGAGGALIAWLGQLGISLPAPPM